MKCPDSLIRLTLIFYISCLLCTTTLNFFQVQSRLEAFLLYGTFHLLPFLSRILHPQILTELSLSSVLKYFYTLPTFHSVPYHNHLHYLFYVPHVTICHCLCFLYSCLIITLGYKHHESRNIFCFTYCCIWNT